MKEDLYVVRRQRKEKEVHPFSKETRKEGRTKGFVGAQLTSFGSPTREGPI